MTNTDKYKLYKNLFLFWFFGSTYASLELIFRNRSHWSMIVLGGVCGLLIGLLNKYLFSWEDSVITQGIIGSLIVTFGELIVGSIVNLKLHWNVWDYSNVPFNVLGQICIPFMFLWFIISILVIIVDDYMRYCLFEEEKPYYRWW